MSIRVFVFVVLEINVCSSSCSSCCCFLRWLVVVVVVVAVQVVFSADGKLLASVGNDRRQSVCLHQWESGQILFCGFVEDGAGGGGLGEDSRRRSQALSCAILNSSNTLVVSGDCFVHFWSTMLSGTYSKRAGNRSRFASLQPVTVVAALHGTTHCVSGTACGQLLLWIDINCLRCVKAHKGTVNCLNSTVHGLLSAGADCRIRMWTNNLEPGFTFDLSLCGIRPIIRGVDISEDGTNIVLCTKGGNVYEISAIDGSDLRGGPVAVGHSAGALQGLATHPSKFEFATTGQDGTLRVFDTGSKSQLKLAAFSGSSVNCVTYSPLGDSLVVGIGRMMLPTQETEAYVNKDTVLPVGSFLGKPSQFLSLLYPSGTAAVLVAPVS